MYDFCISFAQKSYILMIVHAISSLYNRDIKKGIQNMKKIIMMICLACLICGCDKKDETYTKITEDTQNLSTSMQHYFHVEALEETQGDVFQAKLLKAARLQRKTSKYDVYVYHIIIAPSSTKVKRFGDIYFSPDESVLPYMNNTKIGMTSLSQSNEIFQNVAYPTIENMEDYTAFQYDICMDVMNKETMIEEKMKHITIEIAYQDHQKETLVLDFDQHGFDEVIDQPHIGLKPFE